MPAAQLITPTYPSLASHQSISQRCALMSNAKFFAIQMRRNERVKGQRDACEALKTDQLAGILTRQRSAPVHNHCANFCFKPNFKHNRDDDFVTQHPNCAQQPGQLFSPAFGRPNQLSVVPKFWICHSHDPQPNRQALFSFPHLPAHAPELLPLLMLYIWLVPPTPTASSQ